MDLKNVTLSAGTVGAPDPSRVPVYVIGYMSSGFLPLEVFRDLAVRKGPSPTRTEDEAWATLAAEARAAWARENPF